MACPVLAGFAAVTNTKRFDDTQPHALPPQLNADEFPDPREPLDWGHARTVAAARLVESSIEHDNVAHTAASGMADEFAAQLCAYGLFADEVVHMHSHDDAPREDERVTPQPPANPDIAPEIAV